MKNRSDRELGKTSVFQSFKQVARVTTAVAAVGYVGYYFLYCAQKPTLTHASSSSVEDASSSVEEASSFSTSGYRQDLIPRLIAATDSLRARYYPTFWATNAHLNTGVSTYLRSLPSTVAYRRIELLAEDGGRVYVDWSRPVLQNNLDRHRFTFPGADDDSVSSATIHIPASDSRSALNKLHPTVDRYFNDEALPPHTPTLLICAGLNGGSSSNYVMHLAQLALQRGWFVCCLNNRGANGTPLHTPKTYCGAYTDDIRLAMRHIKEMRGAAPVVAAGFSLGANMLSKFVAEECRDQREGRSQESLAPAGAVVISNPWDFHEASRALQRVPTFDRVMTEGLVRQFSQHYRSVGWDAHADLDAEVILHQTKSVYDFDEQVTRRVWGYESVEAYYEDASSSRYLHLIDIPFIGINALDDPLIPPQAIPFAKFRANPHLLLITTPCGGHVGFAEGCLPIGDICTWAERVAMDCLHQLLTLL